MPILSRRRLGTALAALTGLAAATALLVPRREEPPLSAQSPTIVMDDALLRATPAATVAALRTLRHLGVDWVRVTASWAAIAPSPTSRRRPSLAAADPAAYPPAGWEALDHVVREADRRGLQAMIDLAGPPPQWAAGRPELEFARFAAAVSRRYSGRFRGLPAAAAFAVGNRPNRLTGAQGGRRAGSAVVLADRYRAVIYATVPAVRRQAPGSLVLLGNTASSSSPGAGGASPLAFLRELACVGEDGRRSRRPPCRRFRPLPGDGWAHEAGASGTPVAHTVVLAGLAPTARLLRRLRRQGRLAAPMPVYLTGHDQSARAGLYDQARRLGEAEWLAHRTPGVRGFAQAPLRDGAGSSGGLELADGTPKPALAAFAFPLVVHRGGPRTVRIWGRVRPRSSRGRFRVAVRLVDGGWRALPQFRRPRRTDDAGFFELAARTGPGGTPIDPGATFRLEVLDPEIGWRPAGLPIFGAAPPPRP